MATIDLTNATFEQTITGNDIVLIDFWAAWCGPCRQFAPVYEAASQQHTDIVFAKVDTEAEQEIAGAANITSIPTLMAFREGVLVFAQPGALPAAALEQVIEGVKGLDMAEVHQKAAAMRALHDLPREISQADFVEVQQSGAQVIDCREPGEYAAGHVPNAVLMPMNSIPQRLDEIPTEGPVYIICASGNRSLQVTDFLRGNGIEAYSVAGGTSGWGSAGRLIVTGS